MNQNPNQPSSEEALTRFIDGELSTPQTPTPEWLAEKAAAQQLGNLLRSHLPARQEPPSEDFFVSSLMQKIAEESPQIAPANVIAPSFWEHCRVWLVPMATAAAVLVVGGIMLKSAHSDTAVTQVYTPLPNVQATLAFNESAQATVINLTGLDEIPSTHDIKAYNVTTPSSKTASRDADPAAPQRFYAANDPDKLLFVMFPASGGAPTFHEMN